MKKRFTVEFDLFDYYGDIAADESDVEVARQEIKEFAEGYFVGCLCLRAIK